MVVYRIQDNGQSRGWKMRKEEVKRKCTEMLMSEERNNNLVG